jgi:hypothetical protein
VWELARNVRAEARYYSLSELIRASGHFPYRALALEVVISSSIGL